MHMMKNLIDIKDIRQCDVLDFALRASFIMCYVNLLVSNMEDMYEIQVLC